MIARSNLMIKCLPSALLLKIHVHLNVFKYADLKSIAKEIFINQSNSYHCLFEMNTLSLKTCLVCTHKYKNCHFWILSHAVFSKV